MVQHNIIKHTEIQYNKIQYAGCVVMEIIPNILYVLLRFCAIFLKFLYIYILSNATLIFIFTRNEFIFFLTPKFLSARHVAQFGENNVDDLSNEQ